MLDVKLVEERSDGGVDFSPQPGSINHMDIF